VSSTPATPDLGILRSSPSGHQTPLLFEEATDPPFGSRERLRIAYGGQVILQIVQSKRSGRTVITYPIVLIIKCLSPILLIMHTLHDREDVDGVSYQVF
jgi:hypothetical protein